MAIQANAYEKLAAYDTAKEGLEMGHAAPASGVELGVPAVAPAAPAPAAVTCACPCCPCTCPCCKPAAAPACAGGCPFKPSPRFMMMPHPYMFWKRAFFILLFFVVLCGMSRHAHDRGEMHMMHGRGWHRGPDGDMVPTKYVGGRKYGPPDAVDYAEDVSDDDESDDESEDDDKEDMMDFTTMEVNAEAFTAATAATP